MNKQTNLLYRLSDANLIQNDIPIVKTDIQSPWYIKVFLSISGWFGALFLLFFIGGIVAMIFNRIIDDIPLVYTVIGIGLIYTSYKIFQTKISDFTEHFYLAISIVGQVFVVGSLVMLFDGKNLLYIYIFNVLFQAYLIWKIPNFIHTMLSSFFMASSMSYFFYNIFEPFMVIAILMSSLVFLYLNEFKLVPIKKFQAIAYGQLFVLVGLKISYLYGYHFYRFFYNHSTSKELFFKPWMLEVVLSFVLIYLVYMILDNYNIKDMKIKILSYLAVIIIGIISIYTYGVIVGIIFLILGFYLSHRLLLGLGVILSLYFISNYYYFYGDTFMQKAQILAVVGIVLLLIRYVLKLVLTKEIKNV